MCQKRLDLRLAHLARVALLVEQHKAPDPIDVRILCPYRVMLEPKRVPHLIKEFLGRRIHNVPTYCNGVEAVVYCEVDSDGFPPITTVCRSTLILLVCPAKLRRRVLHGNDTIITRFRMS